MYNYFLWRETMSNYIIAPIGTSSETVLILKKCIEFIGSKQNGSGSDYSKGKRYIKSQTKCSGNSIKNLYKSCVKLINHDFEKMGFYVYKIHKNKCADILVEIITYINLYADETTKNRIFYDIARPLLYIDILFGKQKSKLKWVAIHNHQNQREDANTLINKLNSIIDTLD